MGGSSSTTENVDRPKNWKEARDKGWKAPVYTSDESRRDIQKGFLLKVYGLLAAQLGFTGDTPPPPPHPPLPPRDAEGPTLNLPSSAGPARVFVTMILPVHLPTFPSIPLHFSEARGFLLAHS